MKNKCLETTLLTFGVMLCVMQNCRWLMMLSMVWYDCCLVARRYFCMARAMGAKMAWAASLGSISSRGCLGEDVTASSSCWRLMWVKASSTATTSLWGTTKAWSSASSNRYSLYVYGFLLTWLCVCGPFAPPLPPRSSTRCGSCLFCEQRQQSLLWIAP